MTRDFNVFFLVFVFYFFANYVFGLGVLFYLLLSPLIIFTFYWLSSFRFQRRGLCLAFAPISFFLVFFTLWFEAQFGSFDLQNIIFHLSAGWGHDITPDQKKMTLIYGSLWFASSVVWIYFVRNFSSFRRLDFLIAVSLFLASPVALYAQNYLKYRENPTNLISYYSGARPVLVQDKAQFKNVIFVYAESTERTFREISHSDFSYSDMQWVADNGIELVGVEQLSNTGWSVAGLVASQCGIPLQFGKLFNGKSDEDTQRILPSVHCLGDMLRDKGYYLEYISGADVSFGRIDKFLYNHGYDAVSDIRVVGGERLSYHSSMGLAHPSFDNEWGLDDERVFEFAEKRLRALVELDRPFVLSLATIAGHAPNGFPSRTCRENLGQTTVPNLYVAIHCTGQQIRHALEHWSASGLLKDTLVVVMSDHLMMPSLASEELNRHKRLNFLTFFGDGLKPQKISGSYATFDIYPTILALLGFELAEGRMGLGVDMLSKGKSTVDLVGFERLNQAITFDVELSRTVWGLDTDTGD